MAEVALPVPLRRLILLHVIDEDFQAAARAAVIGVEAEAANLKRLAAALVLAGVDPGGERLQELIVAREEGVSAVDRLVAPLDSGFERRKWPL